MTTLSDLLFIFLVVFILLASIIGIDWYGNTRQCMASYPNMKPVYSFWAGCTIETTQGRIPSKVFRVTE